jgi:hypothetical protein
MPHFRARFSKRRDGSRIGGNQSAARRMSFDILLTSIEKNPARNEIRPLV